MKSTITSVISTLVSFMAMAGTPKADISLRLYPDGQESDKGIVENGAAVTQGPGGSNGLTGPIEFVDANRIKNVGDEARLDIYLPEKCNGQMIVNIPGGGYSILAIGHEGAKAADWLLQQGIAVCNVIYRLPNKHDKLPLIDVQNAFRYCRAHAAEWGVKQIGILGYSAGGHLAATASNLFADETTRPDFSILLYPVITMKDAFTHNGTMTQLTNGKDSLREFYSMEDRVSVHTPTTLLILSADDKSVPAENSIRYFRALLSEHVCAEMHIFTSGGHGWGFKSAANGDKDSLGPDQRSEFHSILKRWLGDRAAEIK